MIRLMDITLDDVLKRSAVLYRDRPALCGEDTNLTFWQLEKETQCMAERLRDIGIRPGDAVAFVTETNADATLLLYALFRLGAVAAPLNPSSSEEEMKHFIDTIDPRFLFCYRGSAAERLMPDTKVSHMDDHFSELRSLQVKGERAGLEPVDSHAPALLIFTSGSTSSPKAVTLTQYCLLNSARTFGKVMQVTEEDRVCSALPIFHSFCISVNMLIPALCGACTYISRDHHSKNVLTTIQNYRCTILNGVPAMFHSLIKKEDLDSFDISSLRTGFIGGAYCPPELFCEIEERLQMTLLPTLGETECTGGYTVGSPSLPQKIRAASVGRVIDHMTVQIQTGYGKAVPAGTEGEICVTGYLLMPGYWNRGKLESGLVSEDGYIHTGDLGRVDAVGNIYVCGRLSNIIIRAGENISPTEIEKAVLTCTDVRDCCVIGIPDSHYGEEICVCLQSREDRKTDSGKLREDLARILSPHKIPRYVISLPELPRSRIGKTRKKELKEIVLNMIREGNYE